MKPEDARRQTYDQVLADIEKQSTDPARLGVALYRAQAITLLEGIKRRSERWVWWQKDGGYAIGPKNGGAVAWVMSVSQAELICAATRGWRLVEGDVLPDGAPVEAGITLYSFDGGVGHWEYELPPLPNRTPTV